MTQFMIAQRPYRAFSSALQAIVRTAKAFQQRERVVAEQRQREYVSEIKGWSRIVLIYETLQLQAVCALAVVMVVMHALLFTAIIGGQTADSHVAVIMTVRIATAVVALLLGGFVAVAMTSDVRKRLGSVQAERLWRHRQKKCRPGYRSAGSVNNSSAG